MQQTSLRTLTKLEFAHGLLVRMCEVINDSSDQACELLGEIQTYIEMTRSAIFAAEENMITWEKGNVTPEARALHPLRSLLPAWFVRVNDILKELGSSKLLAAASRRQLDDERIDALLDEFLAGANGVGAEERSAVFKLAWDFTGSTFGSRNELYERNYLGATRLNRMLSHRLYSAPNRERGRHLLNKFMADTAARS